MSREMAAVLRAAILASGHSALRLSRETGVPQPTISEFLRGRDMRLSRAEKIAAFLGLSLQPDPPERAGRKPKTQP